jgi:hypothetical protein
MPDALRIGLLGPLQVRTRPAAPFMSAGVSCAFCPFARPGRRACRAASLAERIWPEDPPRPPIMILMPNGPWYRSVPLAGAAEHDLVPGRHRGAPAASRFPGRSSGLLSGGLGWRPLNPLDPLDGR